MRDGSRAARHHPEGELTMHDVIVVGARCAGASVAMLLARHGYRVLLVDRATFPSDIPHGHFIHRHGPQRLRSWGVLDRIAGACPAVTTMTTDLDDFPVTGRDLVVDGVAFGYAPRRRVLDAILVESAVEAGAELRERYVVEDFTAEDGRITGVRGTSSGGGSSVERARIVVGADGRHSRLARTVDAPLTHSVPTLSCWYFSYWSDVPDDGLEVHLRGGRVLFAFPTSEGQYAVFASWPAAELARVRGDIERAFMELLDTVPEFAARVRAGRRVDRFLGATDLPNFLRRPHGPGWALVGDAGCHKDPFFALGICDAFRDAELLAAAIDDGLSGRAELAAALERYEQQRDAATLPDFQENIAMARGDALPGQVRALRAALRHDPVESRNFYLAREGLIAPERFFNPGNLQRIVQGALGT